MQESAVFTCDLFSVDKSSSETRITFNSASVANVFMHTEFCSKLLSSFKPDSAGVWHPAKRTNFEIVGWPRHLKWERVGEKTVSAPNGETVVDKVEYGEILEKSLSDMLERKSEPDGGLYYHFSIADESQVFEYSFNDRARVVAVLCVLYDLEPHPRHHLEINIPVKYIKGLRWPLNTAQEDTEVRFYGDPSKTADVLRNEGWSREGDNAQMSVYRERIHGQQQQMYKISTREQSRAQQVKRTAIKSVWRNRLYEMQDYTCRICLNKYADDVAQLSPDHRVPVIFQADNLTDDNFSEKLMTLCRYCNQQKREFCKRISVDYDWDNSPWAYPEKHRLDRIEAGIKEYAKQNELSEAKVVEKLAERFQN